MERRAAAEAELRIEPISQKNISLEEAEQYARKFLCSASLPEHVRVYLEEFSPK
jgi:hypothetical protein